MKRDCRQVWAFFPLNVYAAKGGMTGSVQEYAGVYVMKVLMVCTTEFSMNGITMVIMNYYRLCKDEVHFDFFVNKYMEKCYKTELETESARCILCDRKKDLLKYMYLFYQTLKEGAYDVVHINGNSATMAIELQIAKIMKVKTRIAHCHNSQCNHRILHSILKPMLNHSYTAALSCSKEAGQWIFGEGKFDVLVNCINVKKFLFNEKIRREKRRELKLENKFVIGHVGLFNRQKNHEWLFELVGELKKKLPDTVLLCISGSEGIPTEVKDKIKETNISENIRVLLKRQDVNELLNAMDVFVFPSRWEGFGMAVIEAQANGLCCVVSEAVPGAVEVTPYCSRISLDLPVQDRAEYMLRLREQAAEVDRWEMNRIVEGTVYDMEKCKKSLLRYYASHGEFVPAKETGEAASDSMSVSR